MPDQRVEINFKHRFSRKSDNGKAFGWLKDYFGTEYEDAIINLVRFVYLPISLAESGASLSEVETEISKAKEYVDEKMMKALSSCSRRESSNLTCSNGIAPVPFAKNVRPLRTMPAGKNQPNTSDGGSTALTPNITIDNDFLELDEEKFTED